MKYVVKSVKDALDSERKEMETDLIEAAGTLHNIRENLSSLALEELAQLLNINIVNATGINMADRYEQFVPKEHYLHYYEIVWCCLEFCTRQYNIFVRRVVTETRAEIIALKSIFNNKMINLCKKILMMGKFPIENEVLNAVVTNLVIWNKKGYLTQPSNSEDPNILLSVNKMKSELLYQIDKITEKHSSTIETLKETTIKQINQLFIDLCDEVFVKLHINSTNLIETGKNIAVTVFQYAVVNAVNFKPEMDVTISKYLDIESEVRKKVLFMNNMIKKFCGTLESNFETTGMVTPQSPFWIRTYMQLDSSSDQVQSSSDSNAEVSDSEFNDLCHYNPGYTDDVAFIDTDRIKCTVPDPGKMGGTVQSDSKNKAKVIGKSKSESNNEQLLHKEMTCQMTNTRATDEIIPSERFSKVMQTSKQDLDNLKEKMYCQDFNCTQFVFKDNPFPLEKTNNGFKVDLIESEVFSLTPLQNVGLETNRKMKNKDLQLFTIKSDTDEEDTNKKIEMQKINDQDRIKNKTPVKYKAKKVKRYRREVIDKDKLKKLTTSPRNKGRWKRLLKKMHLGKYRNKNYVSDNSSYSISSSDDSGHDYDSTHEYDFSVSSDTEIDEGHGMVFSPLVRSLPSFPDATKKIVPLKTASWFEKKEKKSHEILSNDEDFDPENFSFVYNDCFGNNSKMSAGPLKTAQEKIGLLLLENFKEANEVIKRGVIAKQKRDMMKCPMEILTAPLKRIEAIKAEANTTMSSQTVENLNQDFEDIIYIEDSDNEATAKDMENTADDNLHENMDYDFSQNAQIW